jgi:hypothetical protein
MPLKFIRYKDYNQKPQVSTVEELLALARQNPWFPMPYPMLRSMLEVEARPEGISVTNLLLNDCLRCSILEDNVSYTQDLAGLWRAWKGSMYHMVMANYGDEEAIRETRFWAKVPGMDASIHGKPDLILPKHGTLIDLKTTRHVPMWDKVWDDHNQQLQMYRWLVNHAADAEDEALRKLKFKSLGIWYVDDEHIKPLEVRKSFEVATKKDAKYPLKKVKLPEIWSDEAVETMISSRYKKVKNAYEYYDETGELPPYPADVPDPMPAQYWPHQYSPVAYLCLKDYFDKRGG